jgi:methionyl aminopeptidase
MREPAYYIKTPAQIEGIKKAGKIIFEMFEELETWLKPGMKTMEIETYCRNYIESRGAIAAFAQVPGYKHATCISINEEVVHGIPSVKKKIKEGDIVSIDAGTILNGFYGDTCRTFAIGKISQKARKLMDVTKKSLELAIEQAVIGNRLGDIGHAIQSYAEGEGFSVVRDFVGHGVGLKLHEAPQVLHYGKPNTGIKLVEGMVLAIEPMINEGSWRTKMMKDGWTAVTIDGKLSAQYEHSVAITKDGPLITTM